MNLAKRSLYFLVGMSIGTVIVLFIAKQKKIEFPYGPDARTLKSIRVKEQRFFSEQAQQMLRTYQLDSLKIDYLLRASDVDFSKSDTSVKIPCQTYQVNGELKDLLVSMLIERCDSFAMFKEIYIQKK